MLLEQDLSPAEFILLSEILWKLGTEKGQECLREKTLADIATLLRADFAASYIWDANHHLSRKGIMWQIDPKAIMEYDQIWQYDDPITMHLRKRQHPTFIHEIISMPVLKKTRYYNEFLQAYGLYHGLNIYFVRNGVDIGDLRIWRGRNSTMFTAREKRILNLLEPYMTQALPVDLSIQYLLTPREQEVAILVAKGLSDKYVASLLGIGFTTVRTHLNNAMQKMGCHNRTEMALLIHN